MVDATPSPIILVGHVLVTGPIQELQRYLLGRCGTLMYVRHPLQPFVPVGDRLSVVEEFVRGRLVRRRALAQWPLPPRRFFELVLFARQAWLTLWWSWWGGHGNALYIGVNPLNAFVGLCLRWCGRVRQVIYHTVDYVPHRFPSRWLNAAYHWVDRMCVRHCDQVWNLSGRMVGAREARGVSPQFRDHQIAVPMGTDLRVTPRPPGQGERHTVVYFGGLMEKQGVQLGLQALPMIRRVVPQARLLVIGGGKPEDRRRLEALAASLQVADAVEFTGVIDDHQEALERLARCAVAIAPYTDAPDNFTKNTDPGKPKAYLAAGLPVIITDVPEIAGIIEAAGAGVVVPYQPEALASAVVRFLTDDTLFTESKRRARMLAEQFEWSKVFDRAFAAWHAHQRGVPTPSAGAGPWRVSMIIPTYNGRGLVLACLRSLARQTYPAVEVIVVDNGSSDGTAEAVRSEFPAVQVIENPTNLGFVGGCNRGAAAATGALLLFLNNDTVHDPSFLSELVRVFEEDPDCGLCASKILLQSNPQYLDAVGASMTASGFLTHVGLYAVDRRQFDAVQHIFSPKGVSMLISRRLFERLGRFDDTFFAYFDESDLAWRVWLSGHTVRFAPRSVVHHASTATASRLPAPVVIFHGYKNRIRSLIKNLGLSRLTVTLPIHLGLCGALAILHMVRGRGRTALAILRAIGWNVRHLDATLVQRRHVQGELRRRPDRALFRQSAQPSSGWEFLRLYRLYTRFWERGEAPVPPPVPALAIREISTRHLRYVPGFEDGQADVYHRIVFDYARPYLQHGWGLNLGCWTGGFEAAALSSTDRLVSVDLALDALRIATHASAHGRFVCALGQHLPFLDETFDAVMFFTVLEHLPAGREGEVIREIARVLAPGGALIVTTPQHHWLGNLADVAWWLVGHRHYRPAQVEAIVREAGLVVERVDLRGRWASNLTIPLFYMGKYLFRKNIHRHPLVIQTLGREYQRPGYRDIFLVARRPAAGVVAHAPAAPRRATLVGETP